MPSRARITRGLALASCGALVTGLGLVTPPATAAPVTQVYIAQGTSDAASSCSVTSGNSFSTVGPKTLLHGRAKGAVNLVTTWTDGSNSSDATSVSGHYGGKTHLTTKHGAFNAATLTGSGSISINRSLGSSSVCDVSASVLNAIETITTQPAGWYYVTRSTTKSSLVEMVVADATDLSLNKPIIFEGYQGGVNKVTQRAFVTSGQYVTLLAAGIQAGDFPILTNTKTGGTTQRGSNTNALSAVFYNAGSAFGGTKKSNNQYVRFPGSVSCSGHKASLTFKSGASKVAGASVFVNGKKKASVANPKGGNRVVLRHLSKTADTKVNVRLSLKGGGNASLTQAYVPCHA